MDTRCAFADEDVTPTVCLEWPLDGHQVIKAAQREKKVFAAKVVQVWGVLLSMYNNTQHLKLSG